MYWDGLYGEDIFLLAVFLMLSFSVFSTIIAINFFHCLNVDGEKLWQKTYYSI